jgi:hypothetical protein
MAMADQLSQSLDASLALGDPAARDAFENGVVALGFAACLVPQTPPPNLIP